MVGEVKEFLQYYAVSDTQQFVERTHARLHLRHRAPRLGAGRAGGAAGLHRAADRPPGGDGDAPAAQLFRSAAEHGVGGRVPRARPGPLRALLGARVQGCAQGTERRRDGGRGGGRLPPPRRGRLRGARAERVRERDEGRGAAGGDALAALRRRAPLRGAEPRAAGAFRDQVLCRREWLCAQPRGAGEAATAHGAGASRQRIGPG